MLPGPGPVQATGGLRPVGRLAGATLSSAASFVDMTNNDDGVPGDTEPANDRPIQFEWVGLTWNEADLKSAIITFAGTIVGGLAVLAVTALGIAWARFALPNHDWISIVATVVAAGIFAILLLVLFLLYLRAKNRMKRRTRNLISTALFIASLAVLSYFMSLLGLAAGIVG